MNEEANYFENLVKKKFPECRVFKSVSFSDSNLEYEIENLCGVNVTDLHIQNAVFFIDDNKVFMRCKKKEVLTESQNSFTIIFSLWVLLFGVIIYNLLLQTTFCHEIKLHALLNYIKY
jgi:hypothetical protein